MKRSILSKKILGHYAFLLFIGFMFQGCSIQHWGTEAQWDSKSQILMSEDSQVKLRSIQTRVLDTTNKSKILRAAVATMQDLFFNIDVLDEDLGVVSGKKLFNEDDTWAKHSTYYLYKSDELIIFNTNFRTWGPFNYRKDLARMTVTIRPKETTRSVVRASLQYNIRAVDDAEMYQMFFKSLDQSLFLATEVD